MMTHPARAITTKDRKEALGLNLYGGEKADAQNWVSFILVQAVSAEAVERKTPSITRSRCQNN